MVKNFYRELAFLSLVLILLMPVSFNQRSVSAQLSEEILADLQAFLVDPVSNFEKIKGIEDLNYWIQRYSLNYEANFGQEIGYIEILLRNYLKVEESNEEELDIIFYLLLNYEPVYRGYKLMAKRLIDNAWLRPDWFFQVLASRPERRIILRKITEWEYTRVQRCADKLKDEELKYLINDDLVRNEKEKEMELEHFKQFMKDPVGNFDKIKDIDDLLSPIARYEEPLIKNQTLERCAMDILFSDHFQDINEEKISILLHLLLHCRTGIYAELVESFVANVFRDYPETFVMALQKEKNWRSVIASLYYEYGLITKVIGGLGDSDFEREIKRLFDEDERLHQKIRERRRK